jgi:hypothetical protein
LSHTLRQVAFQLEAAAALDPAEVRQYWSTLDDSERSALVDNFVGLLREATAAARCREREPGEEEPDEDDVA